MGCTGPTLDCWTAAALYTGRLMGNPRPIQNLLGMQFMTHLDETSSRLIEHCPVGCDAPFVTSAIVLPEGPLLRCAGCGQLVSQCTATQYAHSLALYNTAEGTLPGAESVARHEKVSVRRLHKIFALIGKQPRETRILDVGCSSGAFLMSARKLGVDAEGVEPSAEAAETARKAGLKVFTGFLEAARFPDASFDAVTLIEIIEHLHDSRSLLSECRRILKPGGILLISTPNAASWTAQVMGTRWNGFSLTGMGGHCSFFNPVSIRMIAKRTGFEVVQIETRNVRFFERGQCPQAVHTAAKVVSEFLNWPARLARRGHDMLVFLRQPS